ncbi:DUF3408 domain-containing protein [Bacteroidales bacterium OttesenSCG-928-A17]|nr:DUF3408 domain-containing protein [Bacteroidales bacterium OttesenSCG-928-A17]
MSSKQTESLKGKVQIPDGWLPTSGKEKSGFAKPTNKELEEEFQKAIGDYGIGTNESIQPIEEDDTRDSLQTQETESEIPTEAKAPPISTVTPKRTTSKQRKESLEEYRQTFLTVPKLEDRKPVFISREVRNKIDEIVP